MSRAAESTRRERTRDALREAALRRFVADGFEATSIADIAGDVGVTTRTFYRYFASKDEVLFADYEARLDWFRRALSVRPRREPITTSVLTAIDSFPDDPAVVGEQVVGAATQKPQVGIDIQVGVGQQRPRLVHHQR